MSDEYKSIDCGTYSRYELAIMHRERLLVGWRDTSEIAHLEILLPYDLETRQGAEYLWARRCGGQRLRVRLDRIIHASPATEH